MDVKLIWYFQPIFRYKIMYFRTSGKNDTFTLSIVFEVVARKEIFLKLHIKTIHFFLQIIRLWEIIAKNA